MNERTYFYAGDVVELKQDVPNKPKMIVSSVPKIRRVGENKAPDSKSILLGVKCFWFTTQGVYQERVFNSKDLKKC